MADATKQDNAIAAIVDFKSLTQQFNNLYWQCKQLAARQTARDYVSTWNVQPTYTVNADGSQGATDETPNTNHPMVGLNVAAGDLSTVDGYLVNDFVTFIEGTGAVAQADRRPAIDKILS